MKNVIKSNVVNGKKVYHIYNELGKINKNEIKSLTEARRELKKLRRENKTESKTKLILKGGEHPVTNC